jgi:hypothetical protein
MMTAIDFLMFFPEGILLTGTDQDHYLLPQFAGLQARNIRGWGTSLEGFTAGQVWKVAAPCRDLLPRALGPAPGDPGS